MQESTIHISHEKVSRVLKALELSLEGVAARSRLTPAESALVGLHISGVTAPPNRKLRRWLKAEERQKARRATRAARRQEQAA